MPDPAKAAPPIVTETRLDGALPLVGRGKVRDMYQIDGETLLFVATDRISAYDVVMKNTAHPGLKSHFLTLRLPPSIPVSLRPPFLHRSMQVRRCKILPIEAIVRGYVTGSAWKEYKAHGTVHGVPMEPGLRECEKFPGGPMFTPSTKAEQGMHDENIHPDKVTDLLGATLAAQISSLALSLYETAHAHALTRGLILADTKFEFGLDPSSSNDPPELVLVDEVLTPDSSRYWPADGYEPGRPQESFDKQYLRDWLVAEGAAGVEGVEMLERVVEGTEGRYREVFERLTGRGLGEWMKELEER
ncbi:hypothetical protein GP486_007795 [Trichoglossum hirsutum]|uniref:Phosphoribosylaminoimidazole-succinocarboxamide synthase n=1 Tax=Trichoglossum hirsutum TaxID=265104 RepID=A0A9P8L6M7_9PEZI|nr:hypothetical protein GP486_007795 [Trichoglossum hirsutum]